MKTASMKRDTIPCPPPDGCSAPEERPTVVDDLARGPAKQLVSRDTRRDLRTEMWASVDSMILQTLKMGDQSNEPREF